MGKHNLVYFYFIVVEFRCLFDGQSVKIMHQASLGRSRRFDSRAGMESHADTHSMLSGGSKSGKYFSKETEQQRKITMRDVQLIMPTLIIHVFTIIIMITVIPYAFSSVLKQMEAVRALEAAEELGKSMVAKEVPIDIHNNTS